MDFLNLALEDIPKIYGPDFRPIESEKDFLIELIKLSNIGVQRGEKTSLFHDKVTRLLEYILRTENGELGLHLTETLVNIKEYAGFYLTENATNLQQLCDVILIQFDENKENIYLNTMKLINSFNGDSSQHKIEAIVKPRIKKMDGNLFECFSLKLSLELLHTYLFLDPNEFETLFTDIFVEWDELDEQLTDRSFEKLLWYGFILNENATLKEKISQFEHHLSSEQWGIKFYRYIMKALKSSQVDREKLRRHLSTFKKRKSFSIIEKDKIEESILARLEKRKQDKEKSEMYKKLVDDKVRLELYQLSSKNLPPNVHLGEINKNVVVKLAVFKDSRMATVVKTIVVEGLTDKHGIDVYVNKPMFEKIKKEVHSGYVHLVTQRTIKQKRRKEPNSELFKWPSTEITGKGIDEENTPGLNEKSALRKMGYQITNMSRDRRWSVLQKAVPRIGLKKVAYTIAGNVKLRKGQKNGRKKFSHSIGEWEHDLARLKRTYYKNDFKWPKT